MTTPDRLSHTPIISKAIDFHALLQTYKGVLVSPDGVRVLYRSSDGLHELYFYDEVADLKGTALRGAGATRDKPNWEPLVKI